MIVYNKRAEHSGVLGLLRFAAQPIVSIQVMNCVGDIIKHNAEAQTYTSTEQQLLKYWDISKDKLEFGDPGHREIDFQPQFVQYFSGFKFVYLNPHNVGDIPTSD